MLGEVLHYSLLRNGLDMRLLLSGALGCRLDLLHGPVPVDHSNILFISEHTDSDSDQECSLVHIVLQ